MKPAATPQQIEQARFMREAKHKKAAFLAAQFPLFQEGGTALPSRP